MTEERTMESWTMLFSAALAAAAKKAGFSAPKFETCATECTWGDRCGLVFYGESADVNERAAKFFEKWARKNLRAMKVVGGYNSQESISFDGPVYFSRYSNGAQGWHRVWKDTVLPVEGSIQRMSGIGSSGPWDLKCEEVKLGFAVSYVYYPCSD